MAQKYTAQQVSTVPKIYEQLLSIQDTLEFVLYRDSSQDNAMHTELDLNGYRAINGKAPLYSKDLVTKDYVDKVVTAGGNLLPSSNAVTESQGIPSGDTVITLNTVDPNEALFYVQGPNTDNSRLFVTFDYTVTGASEITLTESYPTDTRLIAIQETS